MLSDIKFSLVFSLVGNIFCKFEIHFVFGNQILDSRLGNFKFSIVTSPPSDLGLLRTFKP